MAEEGVKIPVSLPGAAQAAQDAGKVAGGLNQLGAAAKGAGAAAKEQAAGAQEAGKAVASLGETSEKGIGIGRTLGEVFSGNLYALGNLTAALKVTGAALKTNLIGILVLAATAAANFFATWKGGSKESGDASDMAKAKVEKLAESFEKAGQKKAEAFTKQLTAMRDAARDAADALDRVLQSRLRLTEGQAAADKAAIDANPNLSATEKEIAKQRIDANALKESRAAEDKKLGDEYLGAAESRDRAKDIRDKAQAEADQFAEAAKTAENRAARAAEDRRAAQIELEGIRKDPAYGSGIKNTPEEQAKAAELGERARVLANRIRTLQEEEQGANSPESQRYTESQKKRAEQAQAIADAAAKDLAEAEKKVADLGNRVVGIVSNGPNKGAALIAPDLAEDRANSDRKRQIEDNQRLRAALDSDVETKRGMSPAAARQAAEQLAARKPDDIGNAVQKTERATLVFDSRSINARAIEEGKTTAQVIAELLKETMQENNRALREEMRTLLKAGAGNR